MDVKKSSVDIEDIMDLAVCVLGLDPDVEYDYDEIEFKIHEKFGCSLEDFCSIVEHLLPLVGMGESPLTKTIYRGFAHDDGSYVRWLVKEKI